MAEMNTDRGATLSESFRAVVGLPPRKNDKVEDDVDVELNIASEPEGGYGGEDKAAKKKAAKKAAAKKTAAKGK